jgi:hypothetical protein
VPHSLRQFIEDSFVAVRRDAPRVFQQLCTTLSGRCVAVRSSHEEFWLRFQKRDVHVVAAGVAEDVRLSIDRQTILALVDGELTIEDALRDDRLELYGAVERVTEFYDGLQVYVAGAVRCPDFPRLLTEFRISSHAYDQEVPYEPTPTSR